MREHRRENVEQVYNIEGFTKTNVFLEDHVALFYFCYVFL